MIRNDSAEHELAEMHAYWDHLDDWDDEWDSDSGWPEPHDLPPATPEEGDRG